jgi:hypothetical protein
MDYGFSSKQGSEMIAELGGTTLPPNMFANATFGGDLLYFTSADQPAFPESTNGLGNPTSYGFRNQLRSSNGNLFVGVANAENLLTDPADPNNLGGLGGWELMELSESPNLNTPIGTNVSVTLANGVAVTYCGVTTAGRTFSTTVPNTFRPNDRIHPLLQAFDLDGPETPESVAAPPEKLVLLWSSARWVQGCQSSRVSVPLPSGVTIPRLLLFSWNGEEYVWKDVTESVDWANGRVTGSIGSGFMGVLGVAQAAMPSAALSVEVLRKGIDATNGFYVELRITNEGGGSAKNIAIESLEFRTLTGSGAVSYNAQASGALPLAVGDIASNGNKVVRLYLKSTTSFGTSGVVRFTMSEAFQMDSAPGVRVSVKTTQIVVP